MKLWRLVLAVLLPLAILVPLPASAGTGLGISISFDKAEQTDAESAGSIWAGGEQGTSLTRTIRVRSTSDDVAQALEFIVYDQIIENDEKITDFKNTSKVASWVSFSPENAIVAPGGETTVVMTINIPEAADDESINLTLRVMAGSAGDITQGLEENVGVQAVIGSKIAIDSNFWLGVGDAMELMPNFEILGVDGVLLNETRYIRVFFENTGLVPLALGGRFQLSDPAFQDLVYEPIDFRVRAIDAGDLGFVDVEVPLETADGFYRSFVTAQHSGVRKTEVFEGNLVFDDPGLLTVPELLIRIGLFLIGGIGLVFGVRLIRGSRNSAPEDAPVKPRIKKASTPRLRLAKAPKIKEEKVVVLRTQKARPAATRKPEKTSTPIKNGVSDKPISIDSIDSDWENLKAQWEDRWNSIVESQDERAQEVRSRYKKS